MFTDLLLAILLVTLVILVFLLNWRDALIVMLVVPLSIIGTFIGMRIFHFTLNMMSLLGLSVVIGVLVDDAIVVVENVYRHIEMGKPVEATVDAMREIGYTVVTITLVLVIVFLPIALTNSLVSDIMRQFCGVIIFAILSVSWPRGPGAAPHVPVRPAGRTACQKPLGAVDAMVRKRSGTSANGSPGSSSGRWDTRDG